MNRLLLVASIALVLGCSSSDENVNPRTLALVPRCSLVPDPGPCMAYIERYYFDVNTGTCKMFVWGGCDGVVPFNTLQECKACSAAK